MLIGPKDPTEIKDVTFDFTNQIGLNEVSSATVVSETLQGIDANPNLLLLGGLTHVGAMVTQRLTGGIVGATYLLHCMVVDTVGLRHKVTAQLGISKV